MCLKPFRCFLFLWIVILCSHAYGYTSDEYNLTIDNIDVDGWLVTVHYTIVAPDGVVALTTNWQYSIDGGNNWSDVQFSAISGNGDRPAGTWSIQWDSSQTVPNQPHTGVLFRMNMIDGGSWRYVAPISGKDAEREMAAAFVNNRIYRTGGFKTGSASSNMTEEYNPDTDTWQIRRNMQKDRQDHGMVAMNGRIYVYGGEGMGTSIEEYNPSTDSWRIIKEVSPVDTRHHIEGCVIDDKIYWLRGSTFEVFDPLTGELSQLPNRPINGSGPVVTLNGEIYSIVSGKIEVYNLTTQTWRELTTIPGGFNFPHEATVFNNRIYVFGAGWRSGNFYNQAYEYNPQTNIWRPITPMLKGRREFALANTGEKMYAIAGTYGGKTVEEFTPPQLSEFVTSPSFDINDFPAPVIQSVHPPTGDPVGGTPITLTGENFLQGARVTVGGNEATEVNALSARKITAKTPPGEIRIVSVAVTNPDGKSATLPNSFTYFAPDIFVETTSIDLGDLYENDTAAFGLQVSNNGTAPLTISSIQADVDGFVIYDNSMTIQPNQSYSIHIGFDALGVGVYTGTLTLNSTDPDTPHLEIPLQANVTQVEIPTVQIDQINVSQGKATIHYTTTDPENQKLVTSNWQYSTDGGTTWGDIEPLAIKDNFPSPVGSSTIVWETRQTIPVSTFDSVLFRMRVADSQTGASGSWRRLADLPSIPRENIGAAAVSEYLYAMGGIFNETPGGHGVTATSTAESTEYNPDTDTWRMIPEMIRRRSDFSAAAVGGQIYTLGGYSQRDWVERYDPIRQQWKTITPMQSPRENFPAVALNGKIYVIADDSSTDNRVEVYDQKTQVWQHVASLQHRRFNHAAAALNGKIYVFGGRGPSNQLVSEVEVYDPTSDSWQIETHWPNPKSNPLAATLNGKIYLFGEQLTTIEEYQPSTQTWRNLTSGANQRYNYSIAVANGRAYFPGGTVSTPDFHDIVPIVEEFTPPRISSIATSASFSIDNKPAPTLTSISPSEGFVIGETYIMLIGANFQPNATVSIGGNPATDVIFVNSTTITAKTPKGTTGAVSVVVNNPDGQSVTLLNGFTYLSTSSIQISKSFIDFSLVKIGRTAKQTLEIQNKGDIPIEITAFDLGDTAFSVSETSLTIAPAENHELVISYTPTDESEVNTTLTMPSNDAEKPAITVYLRGRGVIEQSLSFERDFLSLRKGQMQTFNLFANGLPKISGFEITFRYPADLIQINSIQPGSFLNDAGQTIVKGPEFSTTDDYTTALYKIALYDYISLPEGNGVFIRLTIQGLKSGIASLEIVDLKASGQNSSTLFISTSPLTVSVSQIYGDVNLDGIVNAHDAVLILQYIVNLISLTPEQQKAADVDGVPPITEVDASYVLQYAVGAIDEFPIETGQTPSIASLGVEESRLTLPSLKVKNAEPLLVPIRLEQNRGNLFGANFTLNFDSKMLRFIALAPSPLTQDYQFISNPKSGKIQIALAGAKSITESGVLLFVQFEPIDTPSMTSLTLSDIRLNAHQIDTVIQGSIEILPKTSALLQNYPNPFNPETWIPYQLSEDVHVTISISDVRGELVKQLNLGFQHAGLYLNRSRAAYWDGRNQEGERISSGLYFYRIDAGTFHSVRRMVVIK